MVKRVPIRNFYNRILGYIETDTITGNKTAYNFYNKNLGRYDARNDTTRDFEGRIVGNGDLCSALIYNDFEKNSKK